MDAGIVGLFHPECAQFGHRMSRNLAELCAQRSATVSMWITIAFILVFAGIALATVNLNKELQRDDDATRQKRRNINIAVCAGGALLLLLAAFGLPRLQVAQAMALWKSYDVMRVSYMQEGLSRSEANQRLDKLVMEQMRNRATQQAANTQASAIRQVGRDIRSSR